MNLKEAVEALIFQGKTIEGKLNGKTREFLWTPDEGLKVLGSGKPNAAKYFGCPETEWSVSDAPTEGKSMHELLPNLLNGEAITNDSYEGQPVYFRNGNFVNELGEAWEVEFYDLFNAEWRLWKEVKPEPKDGTFQWALRRLYVYGDCLTRSPWSENWLKVKDDCTVWCSTDFPEGIELYNFNDRDVKATDWNVLEADEPEPKEGTFQWALEKLRVQGDCISRWHENWIAIKNDTPTWCTASHPNGVKQYLFNDIDEMSTNWKSWKPHEDAPKYVFVYGSLMTGQPADNIADHAGVVSRIQAVYTRGELYNSGYGYPEAYFDLSDTILYPNEDARVTGELVEYKDMEAALRTLDRYEGVRTGLFKRVEIQCWIADAVVKAYAYQRCESPGLVSKRPEDKVKSGDWADHIRQIASQRHQ